jgi:hypothetical protein
VNPSEKSPNFSLWDESHGQFKLKCQKAFYSLEGKPCNLLHGRVTLRSFLRDIKYKIMDWDICQKKIIMRSLALKETPMKKKLKKHIVN